MKAKNVIVGLRVELKKDLDHLVKGWQGTIIKSGFCDIGVRWDDYHENSHTLGGSCDNGYGWWVLLKQVRKVK